MIDRAKDKQSMRRQYVGPVPLVQPRGELSTVLAVRYSEVRLSSMVLPAALEKRLQRILREQRQQDRLRSRGLSPRRKLLFVGPPGSGKTMTAAALAGELKLPLFTVLYDGLIGKFMGETASRLKLVFDSIAAQRGVYFFDEFDAIGTQRAGLNDVGEIRRVLNSFLQFLDRDNGHSLIIAATNHPDLLDKALFRRFDDVIEYDLPTPEVIRGIIEAHLATFQLSRVDWPAVLEAAKGLSQGEITRAADEAAKGAVLNDGDAITAEVLMLAVQERQHTAR